jgi:hypothetical protein
MKTYKNPKDLKIKSVAQIDKTDKVDKVDKVDKYTVRSMFNDLSKWEDFLKLVNN